MGGAAIELVAEEEWTTVEASRRLGVPCDWLRRQVRAGRVPVRRALVRGHWVYVAAAKAWEDLAQRYRDGAFESGAGLAYNPLRGVLMTPIVYEGFRIAFGAPPRCVVCGKDLVPGTRWRWFVPATYQPPGPSDMPQLAIGCAHGHEGARIRVGAVWWIVCEEGVAPRRCKEAVGD